MTLVDSHCHLDRLDLFGGAVDIEAVLTSARGLGVSAFLAIGVDQASSARLIELATDHPDIFVSVGAHPLQDRAIAVPGVAELVALAGHPRVVAIGETGLDYHYAPESARWQQDSFVSHLQAGKAAALPVVVHTRDAQADTLALIEEHGCRERGGVLHCFTETREMARAALELNYYISFSGIITFRNAADLRSVVSYVPLDRMLVETDAPWLAPVPYRGQPNVPGHVLEVAKKVAEIKGLSLDRVAEQTTANFHRLFQL